MWNNDIRRVSVREPSTAGASLGRWAADNFALLRQWALEIADTIVGILDALTALANWRESIDLTVGNLVLTSNPAGTSALGSNALTGERGFLVRMVNGTGAASVKGSVIAASQSTDNQFVLQANEFDAFGVVAESGVANGQPCWVWVNGSVAQVLWKDATVATRGRVTLCADTDGRAVDIAVPEHFKEIGHTLESKGAGTNVLVLCQLHFN